MSFRFQDFAMSLTKLTIAIVLAFAALGIVSWIGLWGYQSHQKAQAKPYESVRNWEADLSENLKLKLNVRTKVVSNVLYASVIFLGSPYPAYLSSTDNQDRSFTIIFRDKDDFKIYSKKISLQDFISIVDSNGTKLGLDTQIEEYINIDDYKRFERMTVEWDLNTDVPSSVAKRPEQPLLDPCEPAISKQERLKRLAQYGSVRQASDNSYSAGGRTVNFFFDGSLLYCN